MEEIMDESKLKRDFNWRTLLLFAAPSMLLNLWLGVYQLINSAISSSMIHTDALASIDICYPILAIEEGLAAMLGAGICAIVGKKLGQGKQKEACSDLTTMLLLSENWKHYGSGFFGCYFWYCMFGGQTCYFIVL